jgi:Bax protein
MKINKELVFNKIKSHKAVAAAGLALLLVVVVWITLHNNLPPNRYPVTIKEATSIDSIVLHKDSLVAPIIYSKIPDLSILKAKDRKQQFIHLMLPSILLAREKMATQRIELKKIIDRMQSGTASSEDSLLLNANIEKFKARGPQDLLKRMQPHPASIILAQAAIESGWGTSRFFKEANNIYGIWSYNSSEERIRAEIKRQGKSIYLRKYKTMFDSVYDYLLTIARSHAYKDFREARANSQNPYRLIWFLSNYSEQRIKYVNDLRLMIEYNNLTQYDHYHLVEIDKKDETWKKLLGS